MIPFLDLRAAYVELKDELDAAVQRVLGSGWYIGGSEVAAFEEAFAAHTGAEHCVGVGNGLDALHLALRAMDIGPGDEVILSSNSYIATLLAVTMVGATPVLVDPDPQSHNLDPGKVEAAVTAQTRALLPTHLYGQPADLDPLLQIARTRGLWLLEDAAQAHGARYKGKRLGAHGDAVAWSFYPSKNLGALGDAGALTTNNAEIAQRVRVLGNYGSPVRYVNEVKGFNSRLDPIQAAVLTVKLHHLDVWNARRQAIASYYSSELSGLDLDVPMVPDWAEPVWHLYVVRSARRNVLRETLTQQGVQTQIHYPIPPHLQEAYRNLCLAKGSFPIAERLADEVLSLPIGPHLSLEQAAQLVAAVQKAATS